MRGLSGVFVMSKVWMNGALVDRDAARISVFDHGLLYGDGCFEGIRAYGGRVMKLRSHVRRMYESARRLRLEPPYDEVRFEAAIRETLDANGLKDAYVRAVFTRGEGTLGLNPFLCPRPTVFVIADKITLYPDELYENGMPVIVAQRRRVPIACLDPAIKSLNYLNNILAKVEAVEKNVLEGIMLNEYGQVAECTGDNIFLIKDGAIVTPHREAGILHGITRQFVIDTLAPRLGLPLTERAVELDELLHADEVFLTGTAAEIIGVSKIDDQVIGEGRVGPITRRLVEAFRAQIRDGVPED
jgi:branched-chain amino acid aminotransferase